MFEQDLEIQKFLKYLKDNSNMEKLGTNSDNKSETIHRWFSFLPGFSHIFVKTTFEHFKTQNNNYCVFDPFMGSGTTAVVGRNVGVKVIGNESHRFLYEISKIKTKKIRCSATFEKIGKSVLVKGRSAWKKTVILSESSLLRKCYSWQSLKKLVALRNTYFSNNIPMEYKPYIFLAISSLLPKCAKVGISVPYVSWSHKRIPKEPFKLFEEMIKKMKDDMTKFKTAENEKDVKIYLHDSRKENRRINSSSVDLVFTSPPYLNNFDYGEALKVYTYFWGITKDWNEITKRIRRKSVTSATTHYRECEFINKNPKEILGDNMKKIVPKTVNKIIKKVNLIHKARKKKHRKKSFDILTALYFRDMFQVLKEVYRVLKDDGMVFMVIGDSAPYGIYVPTDKILGEMAVEFGFSNYVLETLRLRGRKWLNLTHRHQITLRESLLILRK